MVHEGIAKKIISEGIGAFIPHPAIIKETSIKKVIGVFAYPIMINLFKKN